ncbi:MAG TPA: D-alanyl-D-alanine carboxypeptidase [Lachnospiraceae bacterium]|nr:D-alanyl-D-alanine carboxypeptidase [Lachnospiraceae bacterium]
MKWTKRTAALLAALLLLPTAARAGGAYKAPPREERTILDSRLAPPGEAKDPAKLPELTVVTPEPAREPEGPSFPEGEDWQLLLANPWNEIPEDYEVTLKTLPDGMKVDERAYDDLTAMLQACRDAGLAPKICSAYRTMAKQTYLYNNKIARLRNAGYSKKAAQEEAGRWVARPGTSEHQLGLAVDIVSSSYQALTKKQEKTAEQKWLMEHCWDYGFILRYPNDKSEITGIGYEPWHYRYVGVEIAQDVRESGLCFEEYLLLREETLSAETPL